MACRADVAVQESKMAELMGKAAQATAAADAAEEVSAGKGVPRPATSPGTRTFVVVH